MNTVCRYHESIIPVKTTYKPKIKKRNRSQIIVVLNAKRKKRN